MKRFYILCVFTVFLNTAIAGFKLPKSIFENTQIAEASEKAQKENKPLVFLIAGEESS